VSLNGKSRTAVKNNIAASRQFSASLQGLQISLGQGVLPALTQAAQVGSGFAQFLGRQPHQLLAAETGAILLGVGYLKLVKPLVTLTKETKAYAAASKLVEAASLAEGAAIGVAAVAVVGAIIATKHQIDESKK